MAAPVEIPVGQRFGELTILGRAPAPRGQSGTLVFVRCDCGQEKRMRLRAIVRRGISSCGTSKHHDRSRAEQGESIMGRRFGTLTVIRATHEAATKGHAQVLVRCDCGSERYAVINHLRRGSIASCGGDAHRAIKIQSKRWTVGGKAKTYAIEGVGTGLIKIGQARNVEARLLKLQRPCPVELRVIAVCDDNVEARLHATLEVHRAHGEWFRDCDEVRAAIMSLCRAESLSVLEKIGIGKRGSVRGTKYRCNRCGELGHFAKTCGREIKSANLQQSVITDVR